MSHFVILFLIQQPKLSLEHVIYTHITFLNIMQVLVSSCGTLFVLVVILKGIHKHKHNLFGN